MSSPLTRAGKLGANWNERYAHLSVQAAWRVLVDFIPSGLALLDEGWGLKPDPQKLAIPACLASAANLSPGMSSS